MSAREKKIGLYLKTLHPGKMEYTSQQIKN